MTLIDLVVDTNVLSHAQNPDNPYFEDAGILLEKLAASSTMLCMDGRFTVGAGNSSLIGQEYLENVGFGGIAFATLQLLMQTDRIRVISVKVPLGQKKVVDSLVPNNKRDRTFVKVAFNSDEQRLASHDFEDFTESVRKNIHAKLGVLIQEAPDVHPDILPDDYKSSTGNGQNLPTLCWTRSVSPLCFVLLIDAGSSPVRSCPAQGGRLGQLVRAQ